MTYFFHTLPLTFSDGVELLGLSDAIAGTPGVEAVAFPTGPIPAGLAAACNSAGRVRNAFQGPSFLGRVKCLINNLDRRRLRAIDL